MLIEFYGKECPHCLKMASLVERLRNDIGVEIKQLEVWHDDENLKKLREYDNKGSCGGVPFFINTETGDSVCGEASYDRLKKWAKNEIVKEEDHSPLKDIDYNYIADGIYIGTNQCCQTHFDKELYREGVEADISLEEERIDAPFGVKFYVWIPVKNYSVPTEEQLDFGVSVLEKFVSMKKKVYVHCQNGHGRSPLLVAAYFVSMGKTPDEAVAIIKSKRPDTHLNDIQMKFLIDFFEKKKSR